MELLSPDRPRRCTAALIVLALVAALAAAASAGPRGEYEVKAAFLINFASLVEWPPEAFQGGDDLKIGILGQEAVVDEVRSRLDGRSAGLRVVRAVRLGSLDEGRGHHMVYVTASAAPDVEEVHRVLGGAGVLLIGETEGFAQRGGAINFYTEKSRIRFEVNPKAVRSAGLRVSSRLLSVAKVVD